MPTISYVLRIVYPDEIDAETMAEIDADAERHDTTLDARIKRWIGGDIDRAESDLSDNLPSGWYAAVDSHDD